MQTPGGSRLLSWRWAGRGLLLTLALGVLFRIGLWQWHKAHDQGDWQNYGYAVQWWLFAAFAVFLFGKLVLDDLDPTRAATRAQEPAAPVDPRPVAPPPAEDDDDELAAWNRHLARLHEQSR